MPRFMIGEDKISPPIATAQLIVLFLASAIYIIKFTLTYLYISSVASDFDLVILIIIIMFAVYVDTRTLKLRQLFIIITSFYNSRIYTNCTSFWSRLEVPSTILIAFR
jgi:hypothetical protein